MKKLLPLFILTISSLTTSIHADWLSSEVVLESELTEGTYTITVIHQEGSEHEKLHVLVDTVSSAQEFIQQWQQSSKETDSPALLVVSLPEHKVQLNRDLTADALKRVSGSGNAHKFYEFLTETIIPKAVEMAELYEPLELSLHTHGKSAAFGFYAMFKKERDFQNFVFESPDMEWHEAYPFRGEYNFYKDLQTELPVKAVFLPILPETTEGSITLISMLKQLLSYRSYKGLECEYADPVELSSSNRFAILKPYL